MLSSLSVLQPFLMARELEGGDGDNDSAEARGSWQSHSPPVHQSARWADGCMGEGMDGWPLRWRREGRPGWREAVLEMEERVDINLTEGMSPSPPQPLSLDAALGNTNSPPPHPLTHFPSVRLATATEPGQVNNSGKKKKSQGLNFWAAPSKSTVQFTCQNGVYKKRLFTKWSKVFMRRLERMQRGRLTRAELIN